MSANEPTAGPDIGEVASPTKESVDMMSVKGFSDALLLPVPNFLSVTVPQLHSRLGFV